MATKRTSPPRKGLAVWLPKDLVRMAKIVAALRGETTGGVMDRHMRAGLEKEQALAVKHENVNRNGKA